MVTFFAPSWRGPQGAVRISLHQNFFIHRDPRSVHATRFAKGVRGCPSLLFAILLLFVSRSALADDGEPAANAESTAALAHVQQQLQAFRDLHGRAPSLDDFLQMVVKPDGQGLPNQHRLAAWQAFVETQQPAFDKSTIAELHRALRQSIEDLRMTVVLRPREKRGGRMVELPEDTHEFAFSGRKLYLEVDEPLSPEDSGRRRAIRAYDENLLRVYDQQKKQKFGTINLLESRVSFFRPESNILFGSMLLDTRDATGAEYPFHDLLLFLDEPHYAVLEARQTIDGRDCICVGNPSEQVWLDPLRNFAVLRFQHRLISDREYRPAYLCELSDFKDCGNGLWLPQQMVRKHYGEEDGSLVREEITVVKELRVNEGVPDTLFTEVIPPGTLTHDGVKSLTYVIGQGGTIESLIDETAGLGKPLESGNRLALILGANLVLIMTVVGTALLRRRQARKSAPQ